MRQRLDVVKAFVEKSKQDEVEARRGRIRLRVGVQIDSLLWLEAERRFRVVWRGFPRARATLEPAENLMPSGCAPRPRLFSIADHVVWTGGASLLRCGARRWRLVGPSGTATRPQHEGPAQAAHAAEGEEEVVALSKFMCARHACGAAGRRPPCSARSAQLPKPCTVRTMNE